MKRVKLIIVFALLVGFSSVAKNVQNYYANKAEEALATGRYEDALEYARQEIYDYEKNANGYYQAALSLCALNKPGQAMSMLNKAIDLSKKNKLLAAQCYWTKAELLNQEGDSIEANKMLEKAIKLDPKNVNLLFQHAYQITYSDPQRALKELEKAKKLSPYDPRCYYYTAFLLTTQNNFEDALEEMNKAISLDKSSGYNYSMRGFILKTLERSPEWIADCLQSVELDPEGESELGIIVLAETEEEYLRDLIIEEIEKKRTLSNGFYPLEANLLYTWDKYSEAEKVLEEMIRLGIADPDTYYKLASCQKELGNILDSYTTVSSGLLKYPYNLDLRYLKAQTGVDVGKAEEVMDDINSLISESPEEPLLYILKGHALMNSGKYNEAVEPFAMAVILEPSAQNKLYYGDALRLSGKNREAASEYQDILAKSVSEIESEEKIPQYMYAMAYSGLGNRYKAENAIKEIAEIIPEAEYAMKPVVLARLGEKSEAIEAIREYAQDNEWNAYSDLFEYDLHNLHSEPEFVNLLAENGVNTSYNPATKLLEYEPEPMSFSSGGTSLEDAQKVFSKNGNWHAELNSMCPIDLGLLGQIISFEIHEQRHSFYVNILTNPDTLDYDELNTNAAYKKAKENSMMMNFMHLAQGVIDNDITIVYRMQAADNSGSTTFTITPQKFKELKKKSLSQDEIDKMLLNLWFEEEKLAYKKDPENNPEVKFEGNNYICAIITPEADGTFASLELFKSDIKKVAASSFSDITLQSKLPYFIRQNINIIFQYKGDTSGKTIDIVFTPDELKQYLK